MATAIELLRQGKKQEIWQKYCGFLDLNIDQYMAIQRKLLEEQLPRLAGCELGARIMKGKAPKTLEEFRRQVPITTYRDYAPYLPAKNEGVLPEKTFRWVHTSGFSGEAELKWVPYTREMYTRSGECGLSCFIISAAKRKGDVVLREGMSFPYTVAPPPYMSGIMLESLLQQFTFRCFPSPEKAVTMDFKERIQEAFRGALSEGLDFFFGVTSILLKISENFSHLGSAGGSPMAILLKPKALVRIMKALLKSRLKGKPLQPRDIWNVRGALCGGMDTSVFTSKVAESWGIVTLEIYAATEFGIMAPQTWSRNGLTFFPETNFWEFITEQDYRVLASNPAFIPQTFMMNEVQPGREYVLVGTNFHGGALVRYILGDLVKIISLEDPIAGVRLPQAVVVSRIDNVIDIGGFTRLTEKTIWQAIEASGVPYEEWMARKEYRGKEPILHLYLELKDSSRATDDIAEKIHVSLRQLDEPYRDLEEIAGLKPLFVSLLSKGTFRRYYEERQAAGADLAHLKPPHINASDTIVENLLRMSSWKI
jgi:hypothetical protein